MIKNHDQWVEISNSPKWPYVSDHPYGILIIGSLVSGKTNVQLNLIKNHWSDIDKIYLYVKNPFKSNYQFHFNGRQELVNKMLKNPKAFIDDSQTINNEYEIEKTIIQKRKGDIEGNK